MQFRIARPADAESIAKLHADSWRRTGRFYLWGGHALYLGPGMPASVHAHHAVQVCIPLSGTVRLRTGSATRWRNYSGAVIPSDQPHESDVAVPVIASFWFDADPVDVPQLVWQRGGRIASIERSKLAAIVPRLLQGWRERFSSERAAALTDEVVRILAPGSRPPIDRRVARVLEIQALAPERRVSLATAAAAVSLSPSRLAHLFTPAVGIPPRRYLLWLRLRDALREMTYGGTITQAAHAAGFADASHLDRTFRRMLGFTPSAALRVSRFVQDGAPRGDYPPAQRRRSDEQRIDDSNCGRSSPTGERPCSWDPVVVGSHYRTDHWSPLHPRGRMDPPRRSARRSDSGGNG